ncbi:MAG: HAD family phosphatase [Prevotellaceae bacterium]|jgi:putative hydrolase of the HAD superfamily|nr:HAD family phosphatase [Prevotellaceae bacterium]
MDKLNLEQIGTIIFDFGGVIVDINRDNAVSRFKEIGLSQADELLDSYRQQGLFLELEEGKLSEHEFYIELQRLAGRSFTYREMKYAWMGFFSPVIQARLDAISELRRRHRVCLLSNTNPIVMEWALSPQFSSSGKSLGEYFDSLYLSYQLGVTKPNRAIFERVIEVEKLNPSETLFVDDGVSNINTAKLLGFRTLQIQEGEDFRGYF